MIFTNKFIAIFALFHIGLASPVARRDEARSVSSATSSALESAPTVETLNGTYTGTYLDSFDQDIFLGMRYAQPPLQSLRFVNPQSVNESFSEVRDAKEYLPSCMNLGNYDGGDNWGLEQSEDCLGINVIRPANTTGPLPVLMYIYGGGFYQGVSSVDAYNLSYVVQESVEMGKPMIGVSFNYRLSGFGFLGGEEIVKRGYTNIGLKDQHMAIEWVQENIDAFGGDPNHIVLWGESAGAISISSQLGSGRLNSSYIRGAIMDSGFATTANTMGIATSDVFNEGYNNITAYLGCDNEEDTFACIQNYENATDIINAFNPEFGIIRDNVFDRIAIDYDYVPAVPSQMFVNNNFTKVPIIIGANSDEGTAFTSSTIDTEDIKEYLAATYTHLSESQLDTILDLYEDKNPEFQPPYQPPFPVSFKGYGLGFRRAASITGDLMFIGPKRQVAENWVSKNLTAYTYRWNLYLNGTDEQLGATHAQELRWNFDNNQTRFQSLSPQQQNQTLISLFNRDGLYRNHQGEAVTMAEVISKQWISFITTLNPNNHDIYGIPHWPSYGSQYEPKKNYVYDWRSVSTEIDNFREDAINYGYTLADDLFIAY
ncbi:unnamed protein product [Debaryomyces tyrocola]|nr:unnamed protein product [Debaryomyces tyrocola]